MARNGFHYQGRTFRWCIHNFHMSPHLPGKDILSPHFSFEPAGFVNLYLRLYPRGECDSDGGKFVSLYLVRDSHDHGPKHVCIDFTLTLYNDERNPIKYLFEDCCRFGKGSQRGKRDFASRQELKQRGNLHVICKFAVEDDMNYSPWEANVRDLESLSSDFRDALKTGKYCDLHLKSSDGFLFSVHRAIVLNRFPDMVTALGFHRGKNKELILNINKLSLQALLTYLYSGTLEMISTSNETNNNPYKILQELKHSQIQTILSPVPSAESVSTTVTVKHRSFVWTITGFMISPRENVRQNTFYFDKCTAISINLHVTEYDSEKDSIHFTVKVLPPDMPLCGICQISLGSSDNSNQILRYFLESGVSWHIRPLTKLETEGDKLVITFDFQISNGKLQTDIVSYHMLQAAETRPKTNLWGLQEDLKNLHTISFMHDVVITVDKWRFPTHWCILSARSPVLSEILEKELKEKGKVKEVSKKKSTEITLNNIDKETLKDLLSYIYYGEVYNKRRDISAILKLYVAANGFQIQLLEEKCMSCLKHKLTVNTLGEMIIQISRYTCRSLRDLVKNFVHMDREEILNSSEWEYLKSGNTRMSRDMENIILVPGEVMSHILMDMLSYLYCGKLYENQVDIDLAIKLYEYTDKYELPFMKNQYTSIVLYATNEENVGKVIILCNKHKNEAITNCINHFISCNVHKILKSKEWEKLTSSRVDLAEHLLAITYRPKKLFPEIIMKVLHYLHTGKLTKSYEIVFLARLCLETSGYGLPKLWEYFTPLLITLPITENIGKMIVILHMLGENKLLKTHITGFIHSRATEIVYTYKWRRSVERLCLDEDVKAIKLSPRELQPTVILTLLTYMHSDLPYNEQKDTDFVINLYSKACRFQLPRVKQSCFSYLKKSINTINVGTVVVLAYRNNDEVLKNCVVTYISSHMKDVLNSSDWKTKVKEILGPTTFPGTLTLYEKDFQLDVIVTMLSYMYIEKLSEEKYDVDHVMKLYSFADIFNFSVIKSDCNSFFERVISTENLTKFLILRERYKDDKIQKCVQNFVTQNVDAVLKSDEWEKEVKKKFNIDGDLHGFALDVKSLGLSAIDALVSYIYFGTINAGQTEMNSVIELYSFSGRHGSSILSAVCATLFIKLINWENVSKLLRFANKHRDEVIESCVRDFALSNTHKVLRSDIWRNLTKEFLVPSQSMQILASDVEHFGQMNILNSVLEKTVREFISESNEENL